MFGYDWPQLHAALNDLPAVLLLAAVLVDLVAVATKRETLHSASLWMLLAGVVGAGAAVGSGLLAEDVVEHSDAAHLVMERHETLGVTVLAVFTALAAWRLVRRRSWGTAERSAALVGGIAGVAVLLYTSHLGGRLVFEHAIGIPSATLEEVLGARHDGDHDHGSPATAMDSTDSAAQDSAKALHDRTPHAH